MDTVLQFDPFDLDTTITPASTLTTLAEREYLKALIMAFRLNEPPLLRRVYESTPPSSIALVVKETPVMYLGRLLRFVAAQADETPHLEFHLLWLEALLSAHGRWLRVQRGGLDAELRAVQKVAMRIQAELCRLADQNVYRIEYLLIQPVDKEAEREDDAADGAVARIDGRTDSDGDGGDDSEWLGFDD